MKIQEIAIVNIFTYIGWELGIFTFGKDLAVKKPKNRLPSMHRRCFYFTQPYHVQTRC